MYSLAQYLQTLTHPETLCRTLRSMQLCRNQAGEPIYYCGNSAILFKAEVNGHPVRLRCYIRPINHRMEIIYKEALRREELFLYTYNNKGRWVDVVVEEWIEGITLESALQQALRQVDQRTLHRLSVDFDRLAARLLTDEWAHGDLKPDNLLIDPQGTWHLIDLDGCYLPEFDGEQAIELGTTFYQHPCRTTATYDRWLDHFPATLISVQLRALALDPSFPLRHKPQEGILFSAKELRDPACPAYDQLLALFATHHEAIHYRLTQALREPTHRLYDVEALFTHKAPLMAPREAIELFIERGRCGYRTQRDVIIPPLYDEGGEFHEGWAAVRLGNVWHYIDRRGERTYTLPPCEAVKSLQNGAIRYRINGQWVQQIVR